MKRVTSRQRLEYGDEFHASVPDDEDDDYHQHNNHENGRVVSVIDDGETDSLADYQTCRGNISRASSWISTTTSFEEATQDILFYDDDDNSYEEESPEHPPVLFCCNPPLSATHKNNSNTGSQTPTMTSTRKRDRPGSSSMKKSVSFSNLHNPTSTAPTLIPAYDSELQHQPPKKPLSMEDLVDDVQLHILSFLSPSDARSMGATCRQFQKLIHSEQAHYLWADWCCHHWSTLLATASTENVTSPLSFVDDMDTCSYSPSLSATIHNENDSAATANLPLLLGMASPTIPGVIDQDQFGSPETPPRIAHWNRRLNHWQAVPPRPNMPLQYVPTANSARRQNLVQFTGTVGRGDRSIRSDHPLPRPKVVKNHAFAARKWFHGRSRSSSLSSSSSLHHHHQIETQPHNDMILNYEQQQQHLHNNNADASSLSNHTRPSLLDFICRGARSVSSNAYGTHSLRPFVAPYVEKDNRINLTPRMVAYFEVSILNKQQQSNQGGVELPTEPAARGGVPPRPPPMNQQQQLHHPAGIADCVAIGVSSGFFQLHSKMPGWDTLSYGYHGDDGGIFHASGDMIKHFGPSFGAGDTVGCGIDYVNGGIFYTKNGEFLGYAWKDISMDVLMAPLYPTVGIDTNLPIDCNFGDMPFQFNLTEFNKQHEDVIRSSLSPLNKVATTMKKMMMMTSSENLGEEITGDDGQDDDNNNDILIPPKTNITRRRTKRDNGNHNSNEKNMTSTARSTEHHPIQAVRLRMFHPKVSAL